jgi:hypothetical protein
LAERKQALVTKVSQPASQPREQKKERETMSKANIASKKTEC